ncbi:MAG: hypothetical protein Q9P01_01400 [Anaerolineae bacterium]|nr:hypothetical protein [Anaerolineae bacterium]MDQ7033518.1 hypothetical protein [Anaerolineae bacterium]
MTVQEMVQEIPSLSIEDRKLLISVLVDSIIESAGLKKRDILEFAGIGLELYDGTDAQEYVYKIRSEWDNRP